MKGIFKAVVFLLAVCVLCIPASIQAQTSGSAYISGTVFDQTQAVVPNATVEFRSDSTGIVRSATSNSAGIFVLSDIPPGSYKVSVSATGFRTSIIPSLKVDVAKSYTLNFNLELGAMTETVEVTASVGIELTTTDATVGTVYSGESMARLPTSDRGVASLLIYQPLVTPAISEGGSTDVGGNVAGARSDQTTYLLDGGDATSNTEGTGGYNIGFDGAPRPIVPTPAESVEEFRVGTTNPNATFGRAQGGQVSIITKRGTNSLHGSVYWYHQNDNLNANEWELNSSGSQKPELLDNRYGFSVGGPVFKDKTFLFGHFEGRRFPRTATITRMVPTDTFRQGILRYHDVNGDPQDLNFNPSSALAATCGATGTGACDPLGVGRSPVSAALWAIYPAGNTPSLGDGLNNIGFRAPVNNTLDEDFFVVRFDQKVTDKWNGFVSYRYSSTRTAGVQQVDIAGISGCSAPCPTRKNPLEPRYIVAGITGQVTPTLTSESRISWFRHWWEWSTAAPFPQVAGTSMALDVGAESIANSSAGVLAEPINIDTQNGRARTWNGKDTFIAQNMTWVQGRHTMQFGGTFRWQDIFHQRTDKVLGGLTTGPIAYLGRSLSFMRLRADDRPPDLSGDEVSRYDLLYANMMGIIERATQIATRDGELNPEGFTGAIQANVTIYAYELYMQDIWRMNPSFTLTYGLNYQIQTPPSEADGRQTLVGYVDSGQPVYMSEYWTRRAEAARRGETYDPDIGYFPIRHIAGQKYVTETDWNNFGPRVAIAWNPSSDHWLLGNRKTVLRAGYSQAFTRMNGVGLVMTPILGVGLAEAMTCAGPDLNGVCRGGAGYLGSPRTDPATGFRVGVHGAGVTLPTQGPASIPFVPSRGFGETLSFSIDPGMKLGVSHSLDLTYQRELPADFLIEVGYVGRQGRNLTQAFSLNATPFMHVAGGQVLADAFEAVAQQLRAGVDPTAVTPQVWFETMLGVGGTRATAAGCQGEITDGDLSSTDLFCVGGLSNDQVVINSFTTDGGKSYYHAGFISLRRRFSAGWTMDANYTYGHSIDHLGLNQENVFGGQSPFDTKLDRQPSLWDRRHIFNFTSFYELPFGRGKRWSAENNAADKVIGGWYVSGIFTAFSGWPLCVFQNGLGNAGEQLGAACARGPRLDNTVHEVAGGLNMFADPAAALAQFRARKVLERSGRGDLHGLPIWNADVSVGKKTSINERISFAIVFDFLNILNHRAMESPSLDLADPGSFGELSGARPPRTIQFGLRLEF